MGVARAGLEVVIYELERAPLDRFRAAIAASVGRAVTAGGARRPAACGHDPRLEHVVDPDRADRVVDARSRPRPRAALLLDNGMKLGAGHPMGPLTLCDFI